MKFKLILSLLFFFHPAYAQEQSLALELQFAKYDRAQEKLVKSIVDQGVHMSRSVWTDLLEREIAIDEALLRANQLSEIASAAKNAKHSSENIYHIKLDELRLSPERVKEFCSELPKGAMLHVHADGTLDRQTVKDILDQANPEISGADLLGRVEDNGFIVYSQEKEYLQSLSPPTDYLELQAKEPLRELFFLPQEPYSHPFSRFMAFFFIKGIIYSGDMKYNDVTEKIYKDFLTRAQKNKVSYIEISDAQLRPSKSTLRKLEKLSQLAKQYKIILRWNLAFYRNIDAKVNEEKMKDWIDFLKSNPTVFIRGIDFIADESTNPALEKGQGIYAQALKANQDGILRLHRTMHAGELGHEKNLRDAMIMGVERVGHGVKLWQDPVALEYARKIQLGIETNLVSNYRLQVIKSRQGEFCKSAFCDADHPFIKFLRLGLPVSFSTDDEGLFETTMNKECEVAVGTTDIQYSELRQVAINSIETSFADEDPKAKLMIKLKKHLKEFEAAWADNESD